MLTSVAYKPGRAPATQQQFVSVCLPHTIFTLYAKRPSAAAGTSSLSRSGCVSLSAPDPVGFLAILNLREGFCGTDERHPGALLTFLDLASITLLSTLHT